VLCAGSTLLLVKSHTPTFIWCHCWSVAKLACINLRKCGSFSYWFDNLGFTTEGRLAAVLIIPSSWGSQRGVIYTPSMHMACFISFIQQRLARGLTTIIQAEASKKRCQSTTKLVQMLKDWTTPCASATAIADSLVQSKESALCAISRGHLHLLPPTHLRNEKLKRIFSPNLPSTPPPRASTHEQHPLRMSQMLTFQVDIKV
jgi:hypothetical protein